MLLELNRLKDSEIRAVCKEKIESLEHWLRRLIDDALSPDHGDYFEYRDADGNRLIRKKITETVESRTRDEPQRYPRKIDATLLGDAVAIICNPNLFKRFFQEALHEAFPNGSQEARTFLTRLLMPRNHLAHANAISIRQAEQIICYSNDIIDSLKNHYRSVGLAQDYDVPLILKVKDSFGNVFTRSQFRPVHDGGISMLFDKNQEMYLRPGDELTLEVEVDPAYGPETYKITWHSTSPWSAEPVSGERVLIPITNKQVAQQFMVQCRITTDKDWHRMQIGADDFLMLVYKVLPPIN